MLSKVLITLLVIIIAVIYLRKQRSKAHASAGRGAQRTASQASDPWHNSGRTQSDLPQMQMASKMKSVLWVVLAGIVAVGSVVTWLHWQDQQRLVTVLLYRDADQAPAVYRVSKRNLGEGSFITEDGTRVTVSANERIEVVGL